MKEKLLNWVVEALENNYGEASVLDISKHIWQKHSQDLENSGNLFYTWQYDVRWAGVQLRNKGILKPADEKKLWVLDKYIPKVIGKKEKQPNINLDNILKTESDFDKSVEDFNLGEQYSRKEVGRVLNTDRLDNHREGLLSIENYIILFNTLNKKTHQGNIIYNDYFEKEFFRWDSQNRQHPETTTIKKIINNECKILLFARIEEKIDGKTQPFVFCGQLKFLAYDKKTSKPVHIIYRSLNYNPHLDRNLYDLYKWQPPSKSLSQNRPLHKISKTLNILPEIEGYKYGLIKRIKDLIFDGKSVKEIVDIVNLRPNEVKKIKIRLAKVYNFPKYSKLKKPLTDGADKEKVIELSKKKLDTENISGKLNIFEEDVKIALKEFVESDKSRYSNETFNEIHKMLKKKVNKSKIAKNLNIDILIVTEVEQKISKYLDPAKKSKFSIKLVNQILRQSLKKRSLSQLENKFKIDQGELVKIRNDQIEKVTMLLVENMANKEISKRTGLAPIIVEAIHKNKLKIYSESVLKSSKVVKSDVKEEKSIAKPPIKDQKELLKKAIIQMLERNRPLKEISYDLGISTGTVRNYIIEMRNDGINIPGFMKTQEGLSNADIQYRVNVIKSNPLKSPKEIAEIIGISRSTLNYFKKKYHSYL